MVDKDTAATFVHVTMIGAPNVRDTRPVSSDPPMLNLFAKALLRLSKHIDLPHRWSWRIGILDELAFWDGHIARSYRSVNGMALSEEGRFRTDPGTPLQEELQTLVAHVEDPVVKILDVGSGPLTRVGKTIPGKLVELTATDPLAQAYMRLCRKHGVTPLVPPLKYDAEELTLHFPPETFHLACANNCLDHAYDPPKAISGMVELVKPGCHVYLRHEVNVADGAGFVGMHQWNFHMAPNGDFLISDRKREVNMCDLLRGRAEVNSRIENGFIINIIRKR